MEQWVDTEQQWTTSDTYQWMPTAAIAYPSAGSLAVQTPAPLLLLDYSIVAGRSSSKGIAPSVDIGWPIANGQSATQFLLGRVVLDWPASIGSLALQCLATTYSKGLSIYSSSNYVACLGLIPSLAWAQRIDVGRIAVHGPDVRLERPIFPALASLGVDASGVRLGWAQRIPDVLIADKGLAPGSGRGFRLTTGFSSVYALRPWHYWTVDPRQVQELYLVTLTGDADGLDDLTVPASSFQARRRDGDPSWLQVVTHGQDLEGAVKDRPNGQLVVRKGYRMSDGSVQSEEIARVDLERIRIDEGARAHSVTLTGHRTVSTTDPNEVDLSGPRERLTSGGQRRYRCDVDPWVRPGDLVTIHGETFRVGYLELTIRVREAQMEVVEEES